MRRTQQTGMRDRTNMSEGWWVKTKRRQGCVYGEEAKRAGEAKYCGDEGDEVGQGGKLGNNILTISPTKRPVARHHGTRRIYSLGNLRTSFAQLTRFHTCKYGFVYHVNRFYAPLEQSLNLIVGACSSVDVYLLLWSNRSNNFAKADLNATFPRPQYLAQL